ncbi:MAG: deoxyribonuclease V [Gemmataceae bacterium]
MRVLPLHSWDLPARAAIALQSELAGQIEVRAPLTHWDLVAGADVSYDRFSDDIYAGVVVLRLSDGAIIERQGAWRRTSFPYIPGLLSFREAPALLEAFAQITAEPDVVIFDGQGIAHPRRLGIASHIGLWLDRPSIGCAKSLLTGTFGELKRDAGAVAALMDRKEVIGQVVRTKTGVRPVYVSAGHQIDLPSAVRVVLSCCRGYRLPEPIRQAHQYVNELRRRAACENPDMNL